MMRQVTRYAKHRMPLAADGTLPFARYVVRQQGTVEIGNLACSMCHTRVMPDGATVLGAQGNFPFDQIFADGILGAPQPLVTQVFRTLVGTRWDAAGTRRLESMTAVDFQRALAGTPPGVLLRQGTSVFSPPAIPDLIGLRERRYFDKTGLGRHRGIADVMRYAAMNQTLDVLGNYGGFVPAAPDGRTLAPPADHYQRFDILDARVGTDPTLTMTTRRGTGYYKIPSLKGVWYRGPFEHSGSVATLEDWFDPQRQRDDYVPTGYVGFDVKTRAVRGHSFGLNLSAEDRAALIASLKTL